MSKIVRAFICAVVLLYAAQGCAWATTVTVASNTIAGFQPSGIGSNVALTTTAVNGLPTVTCSACFRAQWVGLGGFTIGLAGTNYTVASVDTTSSLTLTANYAGVTSASTATTFYKYIEIHFYSNISFIPLGSSSMIQAGAPGSGSFFKRIAASVVVASGVSTLYIPSFSIDSTTDSADNNTARYTMGMYRPDGSFIQFYACSPAISQLRIPPATPTSIGGICTYNSTANVVSNPDNYYTTSQIDTFLPSCTIGQMTYFATTGRAQACLTVGSGLSIVGGTITSSGGAADTQMTDVASLPATCDPTSKIMYRTPDGTAKTLWLCASSGIYARLDNTGTSGGSGSGGGGGSGTVTSVAVSGANGIGVSGSPITSSGTIALSLGAITPTSVNGLTITTTTGTLTIASGKTATINNTLTLAGTDSTTMTFPASSTTVAGIGIDQSFTAPNSFTPSARTTGTPSYYLRAVTPGDTALTADTESVGIQIGGSAAASPVSVARGWLAAGGTFAEQREIRFVAPTYGFNAADTIVSAIHIEADSPRVGTNATITDSYVMKLKPSAAAHHGLWIDNASASATGDLLAMGTTGTKNFRVIPVAGDLNYVLADIALGTTNTDGFIYYPSMAGVPTGVPTSYTGVVATAIDTTNSRFYARIGGAWVNLSGAVAGPVTSSGLTMATARILGRTTASTGAIEEITVGSGLSLSSGSLTATQDNISVNGSAVVDANFTTTPAAPAGGVNMTWQTTGSGPASVSGYLNVGSLISALVRMPILWTDFVVANDPFTVSAIASGTSGTVTVAGHPGILFINSSTSANSGAVIRCATDRIEINGGERVDVLLEIPATITNTTIRFGLHDATTSSDAVDGCYFELPGTLALVGKCASNSTRTTSSTIATLTADEWYHAILTLNNDATVATFSIYSEAGSLLGSQTVSSNIPTGSGRNVTVTYIATNSGTSSVWLGNIDFISAAWTKALARGQ